MVQITEKSVEEKRQQLVNIINDMGSVIVAYSGGVDSAFLAAVAIGDSNRENIHEWNPIEFEIKSEPNEIYEKGYKIFRRLYEKTKDIMKDMDY